jgi:hypothetical protein
VTQEALAQIHRLARRQHGAFTVRQTMDAGITRQGMRTRLARGDWKRAASGVLAIAGSADTWMRGAMVATLVRPGRVWISHSAAAHLHGLDGFDKPPPLEVLTPRGHHPRMPSGVRLYATELLEPHHVTTVRNVPVTNVATTLCLMAQRVSRDRVAQALDHALRMGRSPRWIGATAGELAESRMRGASVVSELLAERVGRQLPRSWFERLAGRLLAEAGVSMEHEYAVRDGGRIVASLDLADPCHKVGVECQSWVFHGTTAAAYRDARRKRLLRGFGWEIVEVWWWDLQGPEEVVAAVVAAVHRQAARTDLR